jgi:transcriptional antiterminator RfaH
MTTLLPRATADGACYMQDRSLYAVQGGAVTDDHQHCGSNSENRAEIKSWGGRRNGAGRKPKAYQRPYLSRDLGPQWYCLQTDMGGESRARDEIAQQGFTVHLPLFVDYRTRVISEVINGKRQRRTEETSAIRPLFPTYLFVQFDRLNDRWRRLHSTRGVRRLFSASADMPIPVPQRVMAELFARGRGEGGVIDERAPHPQIMVGSEVTVLAGLFEGQTGTCTRSGRKRVRVLLSLFGRAAEIDLQRDDVA